MRAPARLITPTLNPGVRARKGWVDHCTGFTIDPVALALAFFADPAAYGLRTG